MIGVLALSTAFFACDDSWDQCVRGNGEYDNVERELSRFEEIELNASFDVELHQATYHSVEVSGDENILEYVTTKVSGDKLILDYDVDCVKARKDIKIDVYLEELNDIELNGSGNVTSRDFLETPKLTIDIRGSGNVNLETNCDNVRVNIDGSGDVELEGKGAYARYYVEGSGDIDALSFNTDSCNVTIDGSGDVSAHVNNTLNVRIQGSGDLEYTGDAKLNILEESGSGTIRKI